MANRPREQLLKQTEVPQRCEGGCCRLWTLINWQRRDKSSIGAQLAPYSDRVQAGQGARPQMAGLRTRLPSAVDPQLRGRP